MTIGSTTVQSNGSQGNGATVTFSFNFSVAAYGDASVADQVEVIRETLASGDEEVLTSGFTVAANGDQSSSPGGSVTFDTAPSSAYKIWIRLKPSFLQSTALQNQGPFNAQTIEDQLDQMARQALVLQDRVRRAPRVGVQAGTAFDGEITGDLTAGAWPSLKSDLSGFQWVTNSGSATAVIATGQGGDARTLADRFADEINVLDEWLAIDADHSAAFQRAFDKAFAQRGGTIRVPGRSGGYTVNTEVVVTGVVDNGIGWRSGGIRLVGIRGTDRNSVFGGDPNCTIRKTSGSGGIFKFVSCDDMTIENVLLETNSATTDYLAKVMAADSPNITGTNVGFKHVEFRTNNTATVDAQVVISATKHTWFEDCYWPDGQSDALRVGDNVADSASTLLTGGCYDVTLRRCRLQGDINLRHVHGILFENVEFWNKRSDPDVDYGARIITSGDQTTNDIVFIRCTADNDGDDTQTFCTQGTGGRNITDIGSVIGDYAKGFVLNGGGMAAFMGTKFSAQATSDIELTGNGLLLLDHSDHGGSPSSGAVVDSRTNFSSVNIPRMDRIDARTLRLNGVISPSQITGDQNNYAPTGAATAAVWRLDTDARRTLTGIAAGGSGELRVLHNIGSFDIVLSNESASSTAANRFALFSDVTIPASGALTLRYDGTSSRWRLVSLVAPGCVIDEFSSSGTWTKRGGAVRVFVELVGAGGGGGGGGKTTAGTAVSGGAGGGGGGRKDRWFNASSLSATESVTIGAAGASGAGAASDGPGSNGTAGGFSSFGSHFNAFGGGLGAAGDASTASGGGGGGSNRAAGGNASGATAGTAASSQSGGAGGSGANGTSVTTPTGGGGGGGSSNAGAAFAGGASMFGGGGGASGGGVSAGNTFVAGGTAARGNSTSGVAGGATEGTAGTAGTVTETDAISGPGGGGGAGSDAGTGGAGGAGAIGGGGGGGGGAHTGSGGAGGAGGAGYCRVTTYF